MLRDSKFSDYSIKKIIQYFNIDIPASKTALLTLKDKLFGSVEIDENYFGAKRYRGYHGKLKHGCGTLKQPVFRVFERDGRIYVEIVTDRKRLTLQAVILGRVFIESVIYRDG